MEQKQNNNVNYDLEEKFEKLGELAIADENIKDECRILWQEVQDYAKMFSKIISTMQDNKN
ncbi:MAG: hypothetical protein PHW01_03565 [Patescibacteria group bacterium]|nr:hypothetical protein [Patescibacteria group bacterium]